MRTEEKRTIAVWFSCGAASAVAAFLTVKKYGSTHNILVFNNPVAEEHPDNLRFKADVEKWIGVKIIDSINKDFPNASAVEVWEKRRYMSGVAGAPCTMLLKKEARYQAELAYRIDWHVLGFTVDEKGRHERFTTFERKNVLPILIWEGLTKADCFKIVEQNGLKLPEIYKILNNANCIGCVKSTGVDYWQRIRKHFPDVFNQRAKQSRELGCRLVRHAGKRIFLDELPIDAVGRKSRRVECGIFCELPKYYKKK